MDKTMGEHADDLIDRLYDGVDEDDFDEGDPNNFKTCRRCGEQFLVWGHTPRGWRLFNIETNKEHYCRAIKNMTPEPISFNVAGVKFRSDAEEVLKLLIAHREKNNSVITPLSLVGEPSNKYDPLAVKVVWEFSPHVKFLLGYVPKPTNEAVWSAVKEGFKPNAILTGAHPTAPTHERYHVSVTFQPK